jgi:hypothetical protein
MENRLVVGVSKVDITPAVGCHLFGYRPDLFSESVNDNLTATAFYFKQGNKAALMITTCICLLDTSVADSLRLSIEKKYGIKKEDILICATHTHSGPSMNNMPGWGEIDTEYNDNIYTPGVIRSVQEAIGNAQYVTMGVGYGESLLGVNRRQVNPDNSIGLGQCRWAPFNPQMTVISFRNDEGKICGNIIHYGCHGTCAGLNVEISRDWSGVMTDALEEESGAVTAFFNGPEGDVGPRLSNGCTTAELPYIYETGNIGANDAKRIFRTIKDYRDVTLSTTHDTLKIPYNKRISYEDALEGCKNHPHDRINFDKQMAVYFTNVKESYESEYCEKKYDETEQTIIRIGDIAFAGFPYELFSAIGMRIDDATKDLKVLSLSNTNGTKGYFPTQDQLCRGGYEVTMFKYNGVQTPTDDADYHLIKETLRNIERLER